MAAIGTALIGKVLGHSDAEKAFRPWWDTLEDNLIYILVMIGIVVVPTAIIMGTPLDCNFCKENFCGAHVNNGTDPGFNMLWVKKYCTLNGSVEPFMLYFPYFLLIIALVLWLIERAFLTLFQAGLRMETFYKFLVAQNILQSKSVTLTTDAVDGGREAIELKQSFKDSNNYYWSYLGRTFLEIIISGLMLAWLCLQGLAVIEHQDFIHCEVHDFWYECSGQPAQFYVYILYITVVITGIYILLNIYSVFWVTLPCVGKLSRLMRSYKYNLKNGNGKGLSDQELLGDLYTIYYRNRDLGLLLNLLATSSGVAPALAIMTLFDNNFGEAMKPKILNITLSKDQGEVRIEFQEPKTSVSGALSRLPAVNLFYIAEISPPAKTSVEGFKFRHKNILDLDGNMELKNLKHKTETVVFKGLEPGTVYSIKVNTVVNGKTICNAVEKVSMETDLDADLGDGRPAADDDDDDSGADKKRLLLPYSREHGLSRLSDHGDM